MDKVAIYCRLSDEDRDKVNSKDDSESIQNQKSLLTKYAVDRGWAIYGIYSDDDYSGLDTERPEFNRMLGDAQLKKFNIVLCKHQSRFTRDLGLVEKYLHKDFTEWGIRFVSLTDNADTSDKGNKKSRQINGLVNEWYCEDISEAIKATFKVKREEGKFIGSFACYGYEKNPANKNKLIIDQEAAKVINNIYELYLEGTGTQRIAYVLNQQGIPNPTRYKQENGLCYKNSSESDGYGLWNKTTVKRILKNPIYIGHMIQGQRRKISYKSKKIVLTRPEDWFRVENTHEPIIDETTFFKVQHRIQARIKSSGNGKVHIFASKVKCLDCGNIMNKTSTGKYSYLRCKLYARGSEICTSHSIRLDRLEALVTDAAREQIEKCCDLEAMAERLQKECENQPTVARLHLELERVRKQLDGKAQYLKVLYMDKVNGDISEDQFYELNKTFIEDKEKLVKRLQFLEQEANQIMMKQRSMEESYKLVSKYIEFTEFTPIMVNELIECIEVGEKDKKTGEQKISIHWFF